MIFSFIIVRYIVSGLSAATVNLGILYFLTEIFEFWYIISSGIAVAFSMVISFTLQKLWTFDNKGISKVHKQFFSYVTVAVLTITLNSLLLYVFVEMFGVWYIFAQVIVIGILATVSFFLYGSFVFNQKDEEDSGLIKILIATGIYPPDIGGPATYAKLLVEELPLKGFNVSVLSFGIVRRLPRIIRHGVYLFELLGKATQTKIILALDPVSVGFPALIVAKILRKKFIVKVVGDYAWEQFQTKSEKRKAKNSNYRFVTIEAFQNEKFDIVTELRRKIQKFVVGRADEVIVPSNFLKKIVTKWNIPEDRINVIYNAFNPPVQTEDKESIRKKLKLDGTIILSAGRMVQWKGFGVLIAVIAQLQKEINNLNLVIIGDGPDKEELEEISRTLNAKVIFTGRLSHEELLEYIYASDLFVLNTGYEGFSHQLLEVMALGVPVVTTNVGGNPELIENQKTGLLVPYNDEDEIKKALRMILSDENFRESIKERAQERVREFSVEQMIHSLITILKK